MHPSRAIANDNLASKVIIRVYDRDIPRCERIQIEQRNLYLNVRTNGVF